MPRMGRPVACECAHGGCSALQVDDQQTPGVFFDIQLLFEGKRLRNTNTQVICVSLQPQADAVGDFICSWPSALSEHRPSKRSSLTIGLPGL